MNTINTIHSCCKNCVFAQYTDKTQTDCALNYINKYKTKNDTQILEAYDDEKEFYIINKKKCIGYRENKWFKQFNLENASIEEKISHFYSTNKLDYLIVINLKDYTIEDIENVIKKIPNDIPPARIILVRYQNQTHLTYQTIQDILLKYNIAYDWRIQSMVGDEHSYIEILHNITTVHTKYRFIIGVESYSEYIGDFITNMNQKIHEDLEQFLVVTTADKKCIGYSGSVYRYGTIHKQHIFSNPDTFIIL